MCVRDSVGGPVLLFGRNGSHRRAFTLVELLLVLAIIALITAITAPNFVRSMRGNRLRAAVDQVVRAGRYARSMAVMRQQEMLLNFEFENSGIEVIPNVAVVVPVDGEGAEEEEDGIEDMFPGPEDDFLEGTVDRASEAMDVSINRALDRVILDSVEVEGHAETFTGGKCSVIYHTNGTCVPYRVKVTDEFGTSVTITVDALAGATTERVDGFE